MKRYVVTFVKSRRLRDRLETDPETGNNIHVYMHSRSGEPCGDYSGRDYLNLQTFFFDDKANADAFALMAATQKPGYDVHVCTTYNIVSATVAAPVVKKITEKGVFPV